jgi:hypothetical protein
MSVRTVESITGRVELQVLLADSALREGTSALA